MHSIYTTSTQLTVHLLPGYDAMQWHFHIHTHPTKQHWREWLRSCSSVFTECSAVTISFVILVFCLLADLNLGLTLIFLCIWLSVVYFIVTHLLGRMKATQTSSLFSHALLLLPPLSLALLIVERVCWGNARERYRVEGKTERVRQGEREESREGQWATEKCICRHSGPWSDGETEWGGGEWERERDRERERGERER